MPEPRIRPDRWLVALALLVAVGYIAGTSLTTGYHGSIIQGDAKAYFSYLPSLLFDGDILLNNQFQTLEPEGGVPYPYGGSHGRAANPFPIAPALLWLPGYVAGVGVENVLARLGFAAQSPGYGAAAVWGAAAASILFAGLGAVLTRRLIAVVIGEHNALPAVLMSWVGTAALYYTLVTPLYSHAVSWFGVASMLYTAHLAVVQPSRLRRWFVAGLFAGYMVAIRLPDASLLVMPLFMFAAAAASMRSNRRALTAGVLAWIGGLGLGYLPQGIASYRLYGRWSPSSPTELGATFHPGLFFDALFSGHYEGWISWTPIIALGLIGLPLLIARGGADARRLGYAAMLGVTALYLTDVLHPYGRAGAAFGARRYVSASPLIAIGLATLINAVADQPQVRRYLLGTMWALVAWNVWLLTCYEILVNIHHTYPTLLQTARYAVGLFAISSP
jgi:hypothetical protein